ncbi:glutamate--cysteine ligase [Candidatus Sororendozoicomonas aggregata]|uniref:glutamate--cysteine ligase n=1 Tax=Candidatus Sororendozoicomonas aggregata TaxID=3073239 RepID=UPI002ED3886C
MTIPYQMRLDLLGRSANKNLLRGIRHGIEREGLRVTKAGTLSSASHPESLGKALMHPYITTDFSEALLEYITPVYCDVTDALSFLEELHRFTASHLDNEMLWAGSMPCELPKEDCIPVAYFGTSNIGRMKSIYRTGLSYRYGKAMQTIAGLHYNFSLPDDFWQLMDVDRSEGYMALIRNFRRYSWLLMYLFGASPAVSTSFFAGDRGRSAGLEHFSEDTLYLPHATSLRMSDMGYTNNAQSSLNVCYDTLDGYVKSLCEAIRTPYKPYQTIGVKVNGQYRQLNDNLLQIENEYYSTIRPKRIARRGEKPLTALSRHGIEYIEVRCLDINPFESQGINRHDADFIDIFLLYCGIVESPLIALEESQQITANFNATVAEGRRPGLSLQKLASVTTLSDWGQELVDSMVPIAGLMDALSGSERYTFSLRRQREKLADPEKTPSARLLSAMTASRVGYTSLIQALSAKHHNALMSQPLNKERQNYFIELADGSRADQKVMEARDTLSFDAFLAAYQQAE